MADTTRERETMDRIFRCVKEKGHPLARWYYGHFHQFWRGEREGVQFSMLDIEELKEIPTIE